MVAIKLRQLLNLRSSSIINGGGSIINHHDHVDDDDDDDEDIQDVHDDLAASIANRELLLTAAAMENTNNDNNNSIEVCMLLRDEIRILRNEMMNRFDMLEKKYNNNNSHIDCNTNSGISVSTDADGIKEGVVPSCVSTKKEEVLELVSPAAEIKDDIGWTEVTSKSKHHRGSIKNQTKVEGLGVENMPKVVGMDIKSMNDVVEELLVGGEDTEEEELNVNVDKGLDVKKGKQDVTSITPPTPTRVLKKGGRNNKKYKKKQTKGKDQQKKIKNKSASAASTSAIPTGYCGLLITIVAVTFFNAIKTLLLKRHGKRLYMLFGFIAVSYLIKEEMNNGSNTIPKKESTGIGRLFSVGSISLLQGVRALEDCPEQYIANSIDSYDIGSKVTVEEKVYECAETPCGWKIIGTCTGDMFLSSSASAQPTIQTLGLPVHFPSMMPSALLEGGSESNLFETETVVAEPEDSEPTNHPTILGGRVRTHLPMSLGTHSPMAMVTSPPDEKDTTSPSSSQTSLPPTEDTTISSTADVSDNKEHISYVFELLSFMRFELFSFSPPPSYTSIFLSFSYTNIGSHNSR